MYYFTIILHILHNLEKYTLLEYEILTAVLHTTHKLTATFLNTRTVFLLPVSISPDHL